MDIKAVIPTIPAAPATAPAPEAKPPRAVERDLQGVSGATAQASGEAAQGLQIAHTHAELAFDESINRVVGRIVNEETGETIHEFPPEQLKALYTKMREALGSLVDGTA
jgi:uncharacterized FlaG/YvyC family protein